MLKDDIVILLNDLDDVARNIYYAMSEIGENHPAQANLKLALQYLRVKRRHDVGLSEINIK